MEKTSVPATLESILALSDQVRAATNDCWSSWNDFKVGISPEASSGLAERDVPVPNDRMQRIIDQVQSDVARLRELAQEIRSRT